MTNLRTCLLFLTAALMSPSLAAESRVCIGGDLDHMSAADKAACRLLADKVQAQAARFGVPDQWHFFVLCSEEDWRTYALLSVGQADALTGRHVETDFEHRGVFFRGAYLNSTDQAAFTRTVARAVAGAALGTNDDKAIEKRLALWTLPEKSPALQMRASAEEPAKPAVRGVEP